MPSNHCFRLLCILLICFLPACSNHDKTDINLLMDARDEAVSSRDILAYNNLLIDGYRDGINRSSDLIIRMNNLFKQFDQIEMRSAQRIIRKQDSNLAMCEQNYDLRVYADGQWRQVQEREQISVTHTPKGWKISGGL